MAETPVAGLVEAGGTTLLLGQDLTKRGPAKVTVVVPCNYISCTVYRMYQNL